MRRFFASRFFFCLALFVLIIAADVLIYGHIPGWSLGLFLALTATMIMVRTPRLSIAVVAINVLLIGIIIALMIQPKFLSILLGLILIAALAAFSRNPFPHRLRTFIRHAWSLFAGFFSRWFTDRLLIGRWTSRHKPRRVSGIRILLGWIIPLILGGIFILLFSQANPVLNLWLGKLDDALSRLLRSIPDYINPSRVFFWIFILLAGWSLLRARRLRPIKWCPNVTLPAVAEAPVALLVRCLLVFSVVFAVQSILDGTYLWGHVQLPHHMTFASYAHRGAYILIVTALLAAGFIAITFRQIRTATPLLRWLLWAWILQNIFLMVSTLLRLELYVSVYSLTYWRVAAAIWMLLIALGFVWFLVALMLRRDLTWMIRMNLLTCFAIFYLCCFPSVAGLMADFNVRHCREMLADPADHSIESIKANRARDVMEGDPRYRVSSRTTYDPPSAPLDLDYLVSLGPEALPALHWLAPRLTDDTQFARVRDAITRLRDELRADSAEWQSQTLRRYQLWQLPVEPVRGAE